MAKGNNALLIFDFDQTITSGHMHGTFSPRHSVRKSDYNSAAKDAVTDADIRNF